MKRITGLIITLAVVAFWLTMNSSLVLRELEREADGRHVRGVESYLAGRVRRERWLGIFRKSPDEKSESKVGYSGYSIEKDYAESGVEYQVMTELVLQGIAPSLGFIPQAVRNNSEFRVSGAARLDRKLRPISLDVQVTIGLKGLLKRAFFVRGQRDEKGDRMLLSVLSGDEQIFRHSIAIEDITLSDGLLPSMPIGDYTVGESHEIQVFNPLANLGLAEDTATVTVVEERTEQVEGTKLDVLVVETRWNQTVTTAVTTRDGEVLRQTVGPPLNLTLRNQSNRANAARGFEN